MKKSLLFILLSTSVYFDPATAQGLYLEPSVGYAYKSASATMNVTSVVSGNSVQLDGVFCSFGQGANFGLNIGFMLNKNIGFELNSSYLLGTKIESESSYESASPSGTYSSSSLTTFGSSMMRFVPSFILATDLGKFSPYAKIGMVIGTGSTMTIDETYRNSDGESYDYSIEFYGGSALGCSGELGVKYSLNERMSLVGGLQLISLSYGASHSKYTKAVEDGVNILSTLTTYEKETEYFNSYSYDISTPPDQNKPDKDIKTYMPFSSVGLNIGFRISL